MRELYLHIGLHKTGTTYLQKLMLENRDLLLEAGLGLGPHMDPLLGTHHPIIAAIERDGPVRVMAAAAACPGAKLLISAEELSRTLEDRARAIALRDAARAHFVPKIVVFLRRQDFFRESYYAETVKTWFSGPIQKENHFDLDHDARLVALEALFGAENVSVRLYHDPGPNDVFGSLMDCLGVAVDRSRLREIRPLNVTPHRRKVLFLSHVPKRHLPPDSRRARFLVQFMRRVITESAAVADDGERFMLSSRERHALVARYLEGNRAVLVRHGITETRSFLTSPDPAASWSPPAPITPAEVAGVFRDALATAARKHRPLAALSISARVSGLFARILYRMRPVVDSGAG